MSVKDYIEQRGRRKGGKFIENPHSNDHETQKWKKTHCPYCDKSVTYLLQQDFMGILSCPHCRKEFKVPSLDQFF